jgi:hypothetical protein
MIEEVDWIEELESEELNKRKQLTDTIWFSFHPESPEEHFEQSLFFWENPYDPLLPCLKDLAIPSQFILHMGCDHIILIARQT